MCQVKLSNVWKWIPLPGEEACTWRRFEGFLVFQILRQQKNTSPPRKLRFPLAGQTDCCCMVFISFKKSKKPKWSLSSSTVFSLIWLKVTSKFWQNSTSAPKVESLLGDTPNSPSGFMDLAGLWKGRRRVFVAVKHECPAGKDSAVFSLQETDWPFDVPNERSNQAMQSQLHRGTYCVQSIFCSSDSARIYCSISDRCFLAAVPSVRSIQCLGAGILHGIHC